MSSSIKYHCKRAAVLNLLNIAAREKHSLNVMGKLYASRVILLFGHFTTGIIGRRTSCLM